MLNVKINHYDSLVLSYYNLCDVFSSCKLKQDSIRIQKIKNALVRFVYGDHKTHSILPHKIIEILCFKESFYVFFVSFLEF